MFRLRLRLAEELTLFNFKLPMSLSSLRDFSCCCAVTGGLRPRL